MKIKGFDDVCYIDEFKLKKERASHSICHFTASVKDETADKYLAMAGKTVTIRLDNDKPIFSGIVQEISIERTYASTFLDVSLISLSSLIDQEDKIRIFQDPDKKYADILSATRLALKKCELRLAGRLKTMKYENVVVQNQETDFAFIRRLARYSDTNFWVNDINDDRCILCLDDTNGNNKENILTKDDIRASKKKRICQGRRQWYSQWIRVKKYIELGRIVKIGKDMTKYLITSVIVKKVHEADEFFYEIEEIKKVDKIRNFKDEANFLEKTVKFKARVTNVKDPENMGRVQVEFIDKFVEDMDKRADKRTWFDYRSPYCGKQGGIVFIPDVGDVVEVVFSNEECFVTSALRQEKLLEECRKVEDKYIGNNTKQRIFWKEKSLELFSFENKIIMDENHIEFNVDKNKIIIDKDKILLQTPENQILLNKDGILMKSEKDVDFQSKNIKIKSNGKIHAEANSEVEISGKGKIKVKSDSKLSLNGSTVDIC